MKEQEEEVEVEEQEDKGRRIGMLMDLVCC